MKSSFDAGLYARAELYGAASGDRQQTGHTRSAPWCQSPHNPAHSHVRELHSIAIRNPVSPRSEKRPGAPKGAPTHIRPVARYPQLGDCELDVGSGSWSCKNALTKA